MPRVAVEIQGAQLADAVQRILRAEGYQVAVCGGPSIFPDGQCPLVEGRGCPMVEQADVIVHALGVEDPEGVAVLEAHEEAHPGIRRVVVVGPGPHTQVGDAAGQVVIEGGLTRDKLLAAIERGLQDTRAAT